MFRKIEKHPAAALLNVTVSSFHHFAVCTGSHAAALFKALGKIALGRKAGELCNIGNAVVRTCQKFFAYFDSALVQVVDGRKSIAFCESMHKVVFI